MKNLGSALVFRLWPWKVDHPLGDADPPAGAKTNVGPRARIQSE
jgi:hypothetical protein